MNNMMREYFKQKSSLLSGIISGIIGINHRYFKDLLRANNKIPKSAQKIIETSRMPSLLEEFNIAILSTEIFMHKIKQICKNFSNDNPEEQVFAALMFCQYYEYLNNGEIKIDNDDDTKLLFQVDLIVCQLIFSLGMAIGGVEKIFKEIKRRGKHKEKTNLKMDSRWTSIQEILKKIKDDKNHQGKSYTINGIANLIHLSLEVSTQTIIRDFKNHLGRSITENSYKLSELSDICNKCQTSIKNVKQL